MIALSSDMVDDPIDDQIAWSEQRELEAADTAQHRRWSSRVKHLRNKKKHADRLTQELQEIVSSRRHASTSDKTRDDREFAMPLTTQLYTVIYRSFVAMWRDPPYVVGMFMLHIFTGLFNTFTFWHLGNSQIDMQSRLFSVFMTLTISPPLIQQLQPRFLNMRSIYESREGNSKIYSWVAFVWGAILSEIPYRIVAGTIYCE